MRVNLKTGLLTPCTQVKSPNQDARPTGCAIDLVVIHSISLPPSVYGTQDIELFFQNKLDKNCHPYFSKIHQMQVSAHLLIKRNGEIIQFVPFSQRAWHAGVSHYHGRDCCNDFSIGIELEGTDTDVFERVQYQQLGAVIKALQKNYPAIENNITTHSHISPERKTDPGTGFSWQQLNQYLV